MGECPPNDARSGRRMTRTISPKRSVVRLNGTRIFGRGVSRGSELSAEASVVGHRFWIRARSGSGSSNRRAANSRAKGFAVFASKTICRTACKAHDRISACTVPCRDQSSICSSVTAVMRACVAAYAVARASHARPASPLPKTRAGALADRSENSPVSLFTQSKKSPAMSCRLPRRSGGRVATISCADILIYSVSVRCSPLT